ncbi:TonB-linked outer membrane protein, SusC/RagA family [Saccharicrinis fermentans DSM 9555 = JCM 21142]|uniref:TonB-linked outer membrane protein, SusC/RagA family n=1 Tax=Saccharicrinis fermentans DSM 9555 = JCM 21142 TaxID=869213 RepID=W7YKC0_9BACT|nr:TonB-linked outer membrane protein, SusC/RagA family [Saccharicrinis fermentans DSM 9555 = JCM 21142]
MELISSLIIVSAQTFEGKITDAQSHKSIPFVNISLKGTYNGTVSDANGNYKLKIPQGKDYTICFSYIGYQSKEIKQSLLKNNPNVALQPSLIPISEVVVMPDSTLRSFLRKAYDLIPKNYPDLPTSYQVFCRGGIQNGNEEYIRFNEVLLRAYKPSYHNKSDGTVEVLKTRKYRESEQSDDFRYFYYGGVHSIHNDDIIKNRSIFLEPHKDYNYKLVGQEHYNDRKVYVIAFKPKQGKKLRYKGKFYIDVKSLGYLKVELKPTDKWIEERYNDILGLHRDIKGKDFDFVVNYNILDSIFYYQSSYYKEKLVHKDSIYYLIDENVVTSMQKDSVQKIPFEQQTPISYVPTLEATEYAQSNWKDYATMPNAIEIDTIMAKELFNKPTPKPSKKEILIKILSRLDGAFGVTYFDYSMPASQINLSYKHHNFNKQLDVSSTVLNFETWMIYKLSPYHGIGYKTNASLSKSYHSKAGALYYNLRLPIKTVGKNVYGNISLGYSWRNFGQSLGTSNSDAEFKFGGKKFTADKVRAFTGLKQHGYETGFNLMVQLRTMLYLNVGANYFWANKTQETIYIKEAKGIFRTEANEALNQSDINYQIDGVDSTISGVINNNWGLSLGISICF